MSTRADARGADVTRAAGARSSAPATRLSPSVSRGQGRERPAPAWCPPDALHGARGRGEKGRARPGLRARPPAARPKPEGGARRRGAAATVAETGRTGPTGGAAAPSRVARRRPRSRVQRRISPDRGRSRAPPARPALLCPIQPAQCTPSSDAARETDPCWLPRPPSWDASWLWYAHASRPGCGACPARLPNAATPSVRLHLIIGARIPDSPPRR